MKKLAPILLAVTLCATTAVAAERALAFLTKRSDFQAIPAAKKQKAAQFLKGLTDADIPMKFVWGLRNKANTNQIWGYAVYSGDAWALKRNLTNQLTDAQLVKFTNFLDTANVRYSYVTNFWSEVDAAGLERIPSEGAE